MTEYKLPEEPDGPSHLTRVSFMFGRDGHSTADCERNSSMIDRIDEIRERRRLSTPYPWKMVEGTVYGTVLVHEESDGGEIIIADNLDLATADAEFITHAPSDIEWLLQEVTYQANTARAALAGLVRYEKRLQKVEAEMEALRAKIAAEIRDLEWDTRETKKFLRDGGTYDHIAGRTEMMILAARIAETQPTNLAPHECHCGDQRETRDINPRKPK